MMKVEDYLCNDGDIYEGKTSFGNVEEFAISTTE